MPAAERHRGTVTAARPALPRLLAEGALALDGRLVDSSNHALVGSVTLDGVSARCVYKPIRGERPLWDFPDGTLAHREVAAYLVSQAAGWDCVPVTVLRTGPAGTGMVQHWVDAADPSLVADLFPADRVPAGWLPVLSARDTDGRALVVAHADDPAVATIAAFDVLVNNADRKASHLLATPDGRVLGADHGLTFHVEPKLRTILWGWAGQPLPAGVIPGLTRLADALGGTFPDDLRAYLGQAEIDAFAGRITALLADPVFPPPPADRRVIPWPPI